MKKYFLKHASLSKSQKEIVEKTLRSVLCEDIGSGDITSRSIFPENAQSRGVFLSKANGVIAGLEIVQVAYSLIGDTVAFTPKIHDGQCITRGQIIGEARGPAILLLESERVILNFLQRLSGIATATKAYVDAVKGTRAVILDTRKTVPGLRVFDKYAVRVGGGSNHRFGLFDMVLIKDNHISAAGGITKAFQAVRRHTDKVIEVEVQTLMQLQEAIRCNPDRIMLDNMSVPRMKKAVNIVKGKVSLEASGGINISNVKRIAQTGVDFISIGALTHSVTALDISFEIESQSISK